MININKQDGFLLTRFPDGQTHVNLKVSPVDQMSGAVEVSITSWDILMQLLQVSNALDNLGVKKEVLDIKYLMGARSDRHFNRQDSFDLKIVARLINMCGFPDVRILNPHSERSIDLIKNSVSYHNMEFLEAYSQKSAVLICPDMGAVKHVNKLQVIVPNLEEVVYCVKSRDNVGKVRLEVLEPRKCSGRHCVIFDDICDGGATFLSIAKQIVPASLTLAVTHGIFSKGFSELTEYFNTIITTNSLLKEYPEMTKLKVIDVWR